MSLLEGIIDSPNNPLAVVEDVASDNNLAFERSGEDEVTIVSKGNWTDYQLSFTWMNEIEALHLACAFDMKIPQVRRGEVQRLIAAINEQLWVGHFDIWTHTGMIMYRQALVLPGGIRGIDCAMRDHAGQRDPRLRTLLSGVSVRGLGRQDRSGGHERRDVRHRGRGVATSHRRPGQAGEAECDPGPIRRGGSCVAKLVVNIAIH